MKKIFAKLGIREFLSFDDNGIEELAANGKNHNIKWESIKKITFSDYFEEYSGYFLTDEYLNKDVFNSIVVNCKRNLVKVRTEGKQSINKNVLKPFSTRFGTTCIFCVVSVEYITEDGKRNMFMIHSDKSCKNEQIEDLKKYVSEDKIEVVPRADGFVHLIS